MARNEEQEIICEVKEKVIIHPLLRHTPADYVLATCTLVAWYLCGKECKASHCVGLNSVTLEALKGSILYALLCTHTLTRPYARQLNQPTIVGTADHFQEVFPNT